MVVGGAAPSDSLSHGEHQGYPGVAEAASVPSLLAVTSSHWPWGLDESECLVPLERAGGRGSGMVCAQSPIRWFPYVFCSYLPRCTADEKGLETYVH